MRTTTPRLPRTIGRTAPALALAVIAGGLGTGPAAASATTRWTYSFSDPGTYTVTIPSVATDVELAATGATGGNGGDSAGAPGGQGAVGHSYDYTEPVASGAALRPGQTLTVVVGRHGDDGAGGRGGAQAGNGGSGGAASAVIDDSGNLVLVASGGSGGGGAGATPHAYGGSNANPGEDGDEDGSGGAVGANGTDRTCGPNAVTAYLTAPTPGQDAGDPRSGGGGGGGGGACPGSGGEAGSNGGGGGAGGIGGDVYDHAAASGTWLPTGDDGAVRLVFTVDANPTGATFTSPDHAAIASDLASFSHQVQAVAAPGTTIGYTLSGAPDWVSIDPRSGLLTAQGYRPAGARGDYPFVILASTDEDGVQSIATQTFTLRVAQAPVFGAVQPITANAGTPFTASVTATGFPAPTYLLTGNVPSWLSIDKNTGLLSGNPPVGSDGSYTVAVVAGNGIDPQVSKVMQVVVQAPLFRIDTTTLPDGVDGKAYSQTLRSTGGTGAITWTALGDSLPPGLHLSDAGVISGTPVYKAGSGASHFTVMAIDSSVEPRAVFADLSITVDPAPVLPVLGCTVPSTLSATSGVRFNRQLAAGGGTAPYRWALASGSHLPAGLTLTTAGLLSGTPTTAGTTRTSLTVADASGAHGACSTSIVVAPPALTFSGATTLRPALGKSYSHTLSATGGTGTRHWALQSGSTLPAGLHLSTTGVVSGKATARVKRTVTVVVTDSSHPAQRVTARLTIAVS